MRMSNETVDTVGYSKYPANVYTFQQMYIHFRVLSCCEVKKFLFKYPENFSIWKKLVAIFPKESRSKWMSIWLNISYMRRNTLYKKNKKSYINFISYVTINFRTTPWPWKGWMFILFLKLLETSSWHSGLLRNLLLEWWDGMGPHSNSSVFGFYYWKMGA